MSRFRPSILLLALCFASLWACEKVPLTAPTGSKVTVSVSKTSVPIGGTAEVTAVVTESAGTAPQNGTSVTFSSTFGTMNPQEALTSGGVARSMYTATGSGKAKIGAFSGGAVATEVDVLAGAAAAAAVSVRTEPSTIPQSGGTVTVIGLLIDAAGGGLPGTLINFTVDGGNLSASAATTDANGEARVTLTTNRTTKVNANAGSVKATEFTLTALANPIIAIGSCTASPQVGVATNCTITPATTPVTALSNVTVNWGDGTGEQPLGAIAGVTVASHTYKSAATYTVTTTAIDQNGQRGTASVALVVLRVLPTISITASASTGSVGVPISFTITPATTPPVPITGVTVDFGDGGSRNLGVITSATTVSRTYVSEGTYSVTATVTDQIGQSGTATTQVAIGRSAGPTITKFSQLVNVSGTSPTQFEVAATASTGLSMRSVNVVRFSSSVTIFTSTAGGTFFAQGLGVGDVLTATATDSAGNVTTFQLIVK